MSATLYRKYRPQKWADLAGQNHVKVALSFEVTAGQIAHAYLFSGPRGTGKTTVARILAKAVNCLDLQGAEPCGRCEACLAFSEGKTLDIIEIDAASHRGIDAVRENIIENARFSPARLKYKVFIIDEVHMLTTEAFNALLKTLEEPPANVLFILATTELHKVPSTIVSRCQRFDFRRIPFDEVVTRLHTLAEREGVKVDAEVLREIARNAEGGMRDAEGLLGKVLTVAEGGRVDAAQAMVVLPRSDYASVALLIDALLHRDAGAALATVESATEAGVEIDRFMTDAIDVLRRLLLLKIGGDREAATVDIDENRRKQLSDWSGLADVGRLVAMTELLMDKRRDVKTSHIPQLPLEIAIARVCEMGETATASVPTTSPSGSGNTPRPPISGGTSGVSSVRSSGPAPRQQTLAPDRSAPVNQSAIVESVVPAKATAVVPAEAADVVIPAKAGIQNPEASEQAPTPVIPAKAGIQNPAESEQAPTAAPAPSVPLHRLTQIWPDFTRKAGEESNSLPFLLGVSEPLECNGDLIRVGFNYAFHRDKFNSIKVRVCLEKILTSLLGQSVHLEGVILERKIEMGNNAPVAAVSTGSSSAAASTDARPPIPVIAVPITSADGFAAAFGGRVVG